MVRAARLASVPPTGAQAVGATPGDTPMNVEVVLNPSNPSQLAALLKAQYDPGSEQYHHWLTPSQFSARFAPASSSVAAAVRWLDSRGLAATEPSPFVVEASGPASRIGAAFGTAFVRYRGAPSGSADVADSAPLVPGELQPSLGAILGLSTAPIVASGDITVAGLGAGGAPASTGLGASGTPAATAYTSSSSTAAAPEACASAQQAVKAGYYTLDQLGSAYGIDTLLGEGLNGSGQTIAVLELARHDPNAVNAYEACFGLTNHVSTVAVDGGGSSTATAGMPEADTDIEQVSTQSPGAQIVSYEGPNSPQGFYDLLGKAVTDDTAKVVSISWGVCEPALGQAGDISGFDSLFQEAAAQGQSVLAASGDTGSEGCLAAADALATTYPASDPWVTAVGGTTLVGPGDEVAWNDCQSATNSSCADSGIKGAGGGGVSLYLPRPSYQPDVAHFDQTAPCGSAYCREVPDLSANAGGPMVVYTLGQWIAGEGTSFAAPFIAGMIADRNQGCTTPTGLFNPTLYSISDDSSIAKTFYGTAIRDVTSGETDLTGDNGGNWQAGVGYDLATGLGVPDAAGLSCPEVQSVNPSGAKPGTTVTVTGSGLEGATIMFGSSSAAAATSTATSATVTVPANVTGPTTVSAQSILGTGNLTFAFNSSSATTTTTTTTTAPSTSPATSSCPATKGPSLPGAVGIAAVSVGGCPGYLIVDSAGDISAFGSATSSGDLAGKHLAAPVIGITATPDGHGYWLLASDGGVFSFGDARFFGSTGGVKLDAPVVGMAPTPDGQGYWEVAKDGGVFSYGDARFHGSTFGVPLAAPVDGMAVAPGGDGYWLVASDGGVFTFTSDGYHGSLGAYRLNKAIVGMSGTPDGGGYTLVASDGGVFSFGDAPFFGSLGAAPPPSAVVSLSPVPSGNGYYLLTSGGGVYSFGPGATNFGGV